MKPRKLSNLFAIAFTMVFSDQVYANNLNSSYHSSNTSNTIQYDFNHVYPRNSDLPELRKIVKSMKQNSNIILSIIAHTDNIGTDNVNIRVSRQRASIIGNYLERHGISKERVIIDWRGEEEPVVENTTTSNREKNRRAAIQFLEKGADIVDQYRASAQQRAQQSPEVALVKKEKRTTMSSSRTIVSTIPVQGNTKNDEQQVFSKSKETSAIENKKVVLASAPSPKLKTKTLPPNFPTNSTLVENPPPIKDNLVAKEVEDSKNITKGLKIIQFLDASTGQPIEVEIDIKTIEGKSSFISNEQGEILVPFHQMQNHKADIFAYGYFHYSEKIIKSKEKQIIQLQPIAKGNTLTIQNLMFQSGTATILSQSYPELNKLVESLQKNKSIQVEIGGHINVPFKRVEDISKEQMQISIDRAKAVYNYLIQKGIDSSRLAYKGYGNAEMIHPQAKTEEERAKNRRVEIKIK